MKKDYTRIAVILDRSGSMESIREATVAGYNAFIQGQRKVAGLCRVKLVQFDNQYECVYDRDIVDVPEMTQATFVPRNMTALLDAQGRTIVELGRELAALPESERPERVIVCTITDGLENASTDFSAETVRKLVQEQQAKYGWTFTYVGANQDAVKVAASMGVAAGSAITYSANPDATRAMFGAMSAGVARARSAPAPAPGMAPTIEYTPAERAAAVGK